MARLIGADFKFRWTFCANSTSVKQNGLKACMSAEFCYRLKRTHSTKPCVKFQSCGLIW